MFQSTFSLSTPRSSLLFLAGILIIFGIHSGCATTSDRGSLQRDRDLNNMITSYEVLPDHNYYFSGSFGRPNAILGIHKDYQLVSNLWQSVQVDSMQMRKWISAIAPDAIAPMRRRRSW